MDEEGHVECMECIDGQKAVVVVALAEGNVTGMTGCSYNCKCIGDMAECDDMADCLGCFRGVLLALDCLCLAALLALEFVDCVAGLPHTGHGYCHKYCLPYSDYL